MSYEMVIEQVKTLPEPLLTSVSAFIKLLKNEQKEQTAAHNATKNKEAFFALAGKVHLDPNEVTELREASLI